MIRLLTLGIIGYVACRIADELTRKPAPVAPLLLSPPDRKRRQEGKRLRTA